MGIPASELLLVAIQQSNFRQEFTIYHRFKLSLNPSNNNGHYTWTRDKIDSVQALNVKPNKVVHSTSKQDSRKGN